MNIRSTTILVSLLALGCGGVTEAGGDGPHIDSIDPVKGSSQGGTTMTVSGSGFEADFDHYAVIGGRVVSEVTVVDDSTLTFATPAGIPGNADVTIVSFGGSDTLLSSYTYNDAPEVLTVDRTILLGTGGESLTLRGVGFERDVVGETTVRVGAADATSVTIVNDSTITAVVGPRAATDPGFAPLDVEVLNENGSGKLEESIRYTKAGLLTAKADGSLAFLDIETGFAQGSVSTTASARKVALLPNGEILGTNLSSGRITTIDPLANIATDGPLVTVQVNSLTADEVGGLWIYSQSRLATLNRNTGAATPVGTVDPNAASQRVCIVDRNAASVFYMSDTATGLFAMSKTTSALTLIRPLVGLPTATGILSCKAMAIFDGELYAVLYERDINRDVMIAVRINVSTGQVTEIDRSGQRIRSIFPTPAGY